MYLQDKWKKNSVDPDQLASWKPADQDLHCFQNRSYPSLAWYGLHNHNNLKIMTKDPHN